MAAYLSPIFALRDSILALFKRPLRNQIAGSAG